MYQFSEINYPGSPAQFNFLALFRLLDAKQPQNKYSNCFRRLKLEKQTFIFPHLLILVLKVSILLALLMGFQKNTLRYN